MRKGCVMASASATKDEKSRMAPKQFANPAEIAQAGQRIYEAKYKAEYEFKYPCQSVAIDVSTGKGICFANSGGGHRGCTKSVTAKPSTL